MEKLTYNSVINADPKIVWTVLWGTDTYPVWTQPFCEGSQMQGELTPGSKILFTDAKGSGMVSRVEELVPGEYISFQHLGELKNGVEDTESEQVKGWAGAHENYTLKGENDKTHLTVDIDIADEYKDYFIKTWPQAMEKIKELSEAVL
jgi:uncharacterized protein YndB with AHSA1/START domain